MSSPSPTLQVRTSTAAAASAVITPPATTAIGPSPTGVGVSNRLSKQIAPHHHHGTTEGVSGDGTEPSAASPPSESRDIPSHTNATQSVQHANDTLLLPKFKKNQRQIDHHSHVNCCDPNPPGRIAPPSTDAGVVCQNSVGLHGFASINMGTRDHMEDRHRIAYGKPDGLFRAFFGVFDGHGGEEASHYTHLHLANILIEELNTQYRAKMDEAAANGEEKDSTPHAATAAAASAAISIQPAALASLKLDYRSALLTSFDKLEEQVLRQSRHIGCRDGTTVTTVLITNDSLICANTGDSRTVLCRENNAVALSHDHKPGSETERQRIIAAGGEVRAVMLDRAAFCCFKAKKVPHGAERLWPGGFSVSRAVGDIDYKDIRRKKSAVVNVLIHTPDVTVTSVSPQDQFIICGSDGLWDVLTNQQAVEFVLRELKKRRVTESLADISQKLADHAYSLGSEDNISALVMFFCPQVPLSEYAAPPLDLAHYGTIERNPGESCKCCGIVIALAAAGDYKFDTNSFLSQRCADIGAPASSISAASALKAPAHLSHLENFEAHEFDSTAAEMLKAVVDTGLFSHEPFIEIKDEIKLMSTGTWPPTKDFSHLFVIPRHAKALGRKPGGSLTKWQKEQGLLAGRGLFLGSNDRVYLRVGIQGYIVPLARVFKRIFISAADEAQFKALKKDEPLKFIDLTISHLDSGLATLGRYSVTPALLTHESRAANTSRNLCAELFTTMVPIVEQHPEYKALTPREQHLVACGMMSGGLCKSSSSIGMHPDGAVPCKRFMMEQWQKDLVLELQSDHKLAAEAKKKRKAESKKRKREASDNEEEVEDEEEDAEDDEEEEDSSNEASEEEDVQMNEEAAQEDVKEVTLADSLNIHYSLTDAEGNVLPPRSKAIQLRCIVPTEEGTPCNAIMAKKTHAWTTHYVANHKAVSGRAKKGVTARRNAQDIQEFLDSKDVVVDKAKKKFSCRFVTRCDKEKGSLAHLLRHVVVTHLDAKHPLVVREYAKHACPKCDNKFRYEEGLTCHLAKAHKSKAGKTE